MLQQSGTGSQKYSSSVIPSSRGRSWRCQCQSSFMTGDASGICGQFRSSIAVTLGFMLETSARLLRLLSLLQVRPEWPGAELAGRLEITTRTLRRDVQRLRDLGYPVHAAPGV